MAEGSTPGPVPIRAQLEAIPSSLIREAFNYGTNHPQAADIIPLWFGEGDLVTPDFVRDALKASLDAGDTFYSSNSGIPELRAAIAAYLGRTYNLKQRGKTVSADRITVTASGMAGITLVVRTLLDAGDNMIIVGPLWPNAADSVRVSGAEPRFADLEMKDGRWQLDLERLFDMADGRTRAVFVNSPNNPTGWMMSGEEQRALLEFCRARGLWLIADEVYDRIVYDAPHAPSFVEIAEPDDAVISLNSFSKSWCMTGWRLGWMVAPPRLLEQLGKLVEFTWSCSPVFVQKAGIAALEQGEPFIGEMVERCRRGRDLVYQRLAGNPRIRIAEPDAAFYAFFGVDGLDDSLAFAKRLIDEARVGVAPGRAFGESGEGYLRLCFASDTPRLSEAMDRMDAALA